MIIRTAFLSGIILAPILPPHPVLFPTQPTSLPKQPLRPDPRPEQPDIIVHAHDQRDVLRNVRPHHLLKLSEGNFRVELELDLLYIACTHL